MCASTQEEEWLVGNGKREIAPSDGRLGEVSISQRLVRKLYRDQISPIQGFVNYSIANPDREIQSRLLSSEARQSPVRDRSREQGDPSYIVGSNPLMPL